MKSIEWHEYWRMKLSIASLCMLCVLSGLFNLSACDMIIPPEEETRLNNPKDPESPNTYIEPQTTIVGGPSDGSTVNTSTVTFTYETNADLFQTRLNGSDWSDWSEGTSTNLEYLDEGQYTFDVRSAYDPGEGEPTDIESAPISVTFTVDAIAGPSLRLSPLLLETTTGVEFELELIAEEVTNLMAVKAVIQYDPSKITIVEVTEGSFLTSTGGKLASYFKTDPVAGTIEINTGTAAGSPPGVSGTGIIATIRLRGLTTAESDMTFDQNHTELRDPDNLSITISNLVGTVVRIR